MAIKAHCLIVPLTQGERVRRELLTSGTLARELKIVRKGKELLIPIKQKIDSEYPVTEAEFEPRTKIIHGYQSIAEIPQELRTFLPRSFDIIGHIVLIKLPEELKLFKVEVGHALIRVHKNIRTVVNIGNVEGTHRLRKIEFLAGEQTTETLHKEHGLSFWLDIRKVYFSPRLAGERLRVAKLVRSDETIIDMFAGIGAFSVLAAKLGRPRKVFAIDVNPDAKYYLEKNIQMNRVEAIVSPILGDAAEIVLSLPPADRIIMNLPWEAAKYFPYALDAVKEKGYIHYYLIEHMAALSAHLEHLSQVAQHKNKEISYTVRILKSYSAAQKFCVIDIQTKGSS